MAASELEDRRGALPRFLRIERLKAGDALPEPLDTTPLLSNGEDWRFGPGRWGRTTGHAVPSEYVTLQPDPLHLVLGEAFLGPIVELRRAR
jgi:hypothetical protein